jgi:hypothetical protein
MASYNIEVKLLLRLVLVAALGSGCALTMTDARNGRTPQARQTQQTPPPTPPPVPKPFPGSRPPDATSTKPPAPVQTVTPPATAGVQTQSPAPGTPSEATLGVRIYPGARFLESYDAGRGQRYYLFGTNDAYATVVAFYKSELRTGGRELYRTPATQQFDLDKFQDETMAFPPSVVIKDYTWTGVNGELTPGYLFLEGTTETRFGTIVQIVPAPAR